MTFNWPTTGFTGTEVETFETAYKELAEKIISTYNVQSNPTREYPVSGNSNIFLDGDVHILPTSNLYAPYKNGDLMEFLLQEAFLYASFIIKQRAGNTGPGTDFDLSSSPFKLEVPRDQVGRFIANLGCVFEKQNMIDAWKFNKDNNPDNWTDPLDPTDLWDEALEELLDAMLNNRGGNNTLIDTYMSDEEFNLGTKDWILFSKTPDLFKFLNPFLKIVTAGFAGQKYGPELADIVKQYLANDKTPWTADTINNIYGNDRLISMKKDIERRLSAPGGRWPMGHRVCGGPLYNQSCTRPPRIDITDQYTEAEKALYKVPPGGKIYEVTFYATDLEEMFGTARVVTDGGTANNGAGEVLGIYDDFDFVYGFEIDRGTPGNGIHGFDYNNANVTHGSYFDSNIHENGTYEDRKNDTIDTIKGDSDKTTGKTNLPLDLKRQIISWGHLRGLGLPVNIRIEF